MVVRSFQRKARIQPKDPVDRAPETMVRRASRVSGGLAVSRGKTWPTSWDLPDWRSISYCGLKLAAPAHENRPSTWRCSVPVLAFQFEIPLRSARVMCVMSSRSCIVNLDGNLWLDAKEAAWPSKWKDPVAFTLRAPKPVLYPTC